MTLTFTGSVYGVTAYGTEYYGSTATQPAIFRWGVEIDWDDDGVFDGSSEAGRLQYIQCNRGRKNWLQPNGQGFYPVSVGTMHITLDNHDGRYDAWNTSSPLYPNVTYGRDVRVRVVDVATETVYSVFYGVISDIVPSGYGANRIVKITVEDGLRYLRSTYYTATGSSTIAPEDAIDEILTGVLWKDRWGRTLDSSADTIAYFATDGRSLALDDINDVSDSFYGQFFVTAAGVARYRSKYTTNTPATYDEEILLKDVSLPSPWTYNRNITRVYWSTYGSSSTATATYPSSTASITYPREFHISPPWIQSSYDADSMAAVLGAFLSASHPIPVIRLVNRPAYQFPELFDIVTLNIPALGINNESYKIGGIEHNGKPQELYTTLYLEPYDETNYWTFPAVLGTTTIFGW